MTPLVLVPVGLEPPPALHSESAFPDTSAPVSGYAGSSGKKKSTSSSKSSGPYWKKEPFLEIGGGGQVFGSGGNTQNAWIGYAEAGYEYEYVKKGQWPRWGGSTRVGGQYIVQAENAEGLDLRVGTFFGPRSKNAGLQLGPDLFYNSWSYGQNALPEAYGVEVPVTVHAKLGQLLVFGGAKGAVTNNPARARDWDLPLHEAAVFAGLGGTLEGFDIEASYEYRLTAAGEQQTIVLSARVDQETFLELLDAADGEEGDSSGGKKKTDSDEDSSGGVGGADKK